MHLGISRHGAILQRSQHVCLSNSPVEIKIDDNSVRSMTANHPRGMGFTTPNTNGSHIDVVWYGYGVPTYVSGYEVQRVDSDVTKFFHSFRSPSSFSSPEQYETVLFSFITQCPPPPPSSQSDVTSGSDLEKNSLLDRF